MTDIDQLMHRFRDYVPEHADFALPLTEMARPGRRRRLLVPAAAAAGAGVLTLGVSLFVRASNEADTAARGPITPTWGSECVLTVEPQLGETQTISTRRALRVLDARATSLQWRSYVFEIVGSNRINARIQASRCADDLLPLIASTSGSIVDLTRAVATDLTGDQLITRAAQLAAGRRDLRYFALFRSREGWQPGPTGTLAELRRRYGSDRVNVRIVGLPAQYSTLLYEPSLVRRSAVERAESRRFAIFDDAAVLASSYDFLDARPAGSGDLEIVLDQQAARRVRDALTTVPNPKAAQVVMTGGFGRSEGALVLRGSRVVVDLPSRDPVVSRGLAHSYAGGMMPSIVTVGRPTKFGAAPSIAGTRLTSRPAWMALQGRLDGFEFRSPSSSRIAGTQWEVVVARDPQQRLWFAARRGPGAGQAGGPVPCVVSVLGAPSLGTCPLVFRGTQPVFGVVSDPRINRVIVETKSRRTGRTEQVTAVVGEGWFMAPPSGDEFVPRRVVGIDARTGKIYSLLSLPEPGLFFGGG